MKEKINVVVRGLVGTDLLLHITGLEESNSIDIEGQNHLAATEGLNRGYTKPDKKVVINGTICQLHTTHLGEAKHQSIGGSSGTAGCILPSEIERIIDLLDVDVVSGYSIAQSSEVDRIILISGIVDLRLILVIVEVGKIKENMVSRMNEEVEVLAKVESKSLFRISRQRATLFAP